MNFIKSVVSFINYKRRLTMTHENPAKYGARLGLTTNLKDSDIRCVGNGCKYCGGRMETIDEVTGHAICDTCEYEVQYNEVIHESTYGS